MVTALRLEERAVQRRAPGVRVVRGGVSLEKLVARGGAGAQGCTPLLLSVGLAGGLRADHPPGVVVIPDRVDSDAGSWTTDQLWTTALRAAARRLDLAVVAGPLVETALIVTGPARASWAARGYVAADMESASIAALATRFAALRVVLDTPEREISPRWRRPVRAAVDPRLWSQGLWLMRTAPRLANRAAAVLAEALRGQAL